MSPIKSEETGQGFTSTQEAALTGKLDTNELMRQERALGGGVAMLGGWGGAEGRSGSFNENGDTLTPREQSGPHREIQPRAQGRLFQSQLTLTTVTLGKGPLPSGILPAPL